MDRPDPDWRPHLVEVEVDCPACANQNRAARRRCARGKATCGGTGKVTKMVPAQPGQPPPG